MPWWGWLLVATGSVVGLGVIAAVLVLAAIGWSFVHSMRNL